MRARQDHQSSLASRLDWTFLAVFSALVAMTRLPASRPVSWHYFDNAAAFLFAGARSHGRVVGLHVYHLNPGYQFGPLSIVVAQAAREVGRSHVIGFAQLITLIAGLVTLRIVADAARRVRSVAPISRGYFAVAGMTFLVEWDHLAIDTLHIDDAIALVCAAIAIDAIARRSAWWVPGLAIGAAAAAKPWAIFFLPLLVVVTPGRRALAGLLAAFVGLGVWAPFVIADSKTLLAAHYTTINARSSVLRLFGVHDSRTPRWDRQGQLLVSIALGLVAAIRHRWEGVVLVAVAVRVMLDPSVNTYYASGLVFGALVWDLMRQQWRWPALTIAVTFLLEFPTLVSVAPALAAMLRLLACVGAIVSVLAADTRPFAISRCLAVVTGKPARRGAGSRRCWCGTGRVRLVGIAFSARRRFERRAWPRQCRASSSMKSRVLSLR